MTAQQVHSQSLPWILIRPLPGLPELPGCQARLSRNHHDDYDDDDGETDNCPPTRSPPRDVGLDRVDNMVGDRPTWFHTPRMTTSYISMLQPIVKSVAILLSWGRHRRSGTLESRTVRPTVSSRFRQMRIQPQCERLRALRCFMRPLLEGTKESQLAKAASPTLGHRHGFGCGHWQSSMSWLLGWNDLWGP